MHAAVDSWGTGGPGEAALRRFVLVLPGGAPCAPRWAHCSVSEVAPKAGGTPSLLRGNSPTLQLSPQVTSERQSRRRQTGGEESCEGSPEISGSDPLCPGGLWATRFPSPSLGGCPLALPQPLGSPLSDCFLLCLSMPTCLSAQTEGLDLRPCLTGSPRAGHCRTYSMICERG